MVWCGVGVGGMQAGWRRGARGAEHLHACWCVRLVGCHRLAPCMGPYSTGWCTYRYPIGRGTITPLPGCPPPYLEARVLPDGHDPVLVGHDHLQVVRLGARDDGGLVLVQPDAAKAAVAPAVQPALALLERHAPPEAGQAGRQGRVGGDPRRAVVGRKSALRACVHVRPPHTTFTGCPLAMGASTCRQGRVG